MLSEAGERTVPATDTEGFPMLTSILVTALIAGSLAVALRSPKDYELIVRRPYENRYSDATAARQSRLG